MKKLIILLQSNLTCITITTQQSVTRVVLEVDDISPEVKSLHVDLNCFLETNFPRHV